MQRREEKTPQTSADSKATQETGGETRPVPVCEVRNHHRMYNKCA